MRPATVERLEVVPRPGVFPALRNLSVAAGRLLGERTALRLFWGIDPDRLTRPDVIVGSGRPAVPVGLLLAHRFGAPYVYSGLADGMRLAAEVDLRLVPTAEAGEAANAVLTPVPSLVAPDRLPQPRPLRSPADLDSAHVALLLGGDAHSHRFEAADWQGIATLVAATHRRYGVRWIVSDSRRTAPSGSDLFRRLAERGEIERFVDCRRPETGSIDDLLSADAILVTEDSVSMMSEAVAAQRRVIALRPRDFEPTLVDEIVATLVATGALAVLPIEGTEAETLVDRWLRLTPIDWDPRDRIAAALGRRLPALFGPAETSG